MAMLCQAGSSIGSIAHGKAAGEGENGAVDRTGPARNHITLPGYRDAAGLRSAVSQLCAAFGKVTQIDILTMAEAENRQALCFLRLESADQERILMDKLGVPRFGEDLLVIVDLEPDAR